MKKSIKVLLAVFLIAIIFAALNNKEIPTDRSFGFTANVSAGKTAKQPTVIPSATPRPAKSQTLIPANIQTPLPTKSQTLIPAIILTPLPTKSQTLIPANTLTPLPAKSPTPAPTKKPESKVNIIAAPISGVSVSGSSSSVINKPSVKANGTPAAASTPFMTPAPTRRPSQTITPKPAVNNRAFPSVTAASTPIPGTRYVLNRHTHVFHSPSCNDVKRIKDSNRVDYTGTRQQVINMGYRPCGHCHP